MTLTKAEISLCGKDKVMKQLIYENSPLSQRGEREDYFESLARSIVSQQISVQAARSVWERFVKVTNLDVYKVLHMDDYQVKMIGLSRQKRQYLVDIANHFISQPEIFRDFSKLSDEEVVKILTKIKGIGVWTAQMFLIFTLNRPDVFAPDDRGLQKAIENNYDLIDYSKKSLIRLSENWRPYRSTACLYLWESLHNN